jgi:hypothetical protein
MSNAKSFSIACALGVLFQVAPIVASPAIAQQASPPAAATGAPAARRKHDPPSAPAAPPAVVPAPQAPLPVSIEQALLFIRSTLLTLNDANRSGNYTVLRDLAAPDFQAKNTAADLSQSFADLRRRNFDLFGAALLAPQLSAAPALDAEKRLRLTGFFPTRPLQISFDLGFQAVGGQWRLYSISVATPEAPRPPQSQAPARNQNAPAPKTP